MATMIHTTEIPARAAQATLRLTRRGRMVFGTLAVLLVIAALAVIAMLGASQAQASTESLDSVAFEYVVAEPGDSLWSLAQRVAPDSDARDVIYDLKRLNQLEGSDLFIGQELAIPLKYTS